jgi:tetratricopeptide (TPR) repeat protein
MKYFIAFLFLAVATPLAFAQKNKAPKVDQEYLLYQKAMQYGDFTVARTAVLELMIKYPAKTAWKDTLLSIYGIVGMYDQAIMLGEDILKTKTADTNTLKIVAISYENLGVLNKAIEYYEKVLMLEAGNVVMRYKLAVCQYGLKRNAEAMGNIERILNDKAATEQVISITYDNSSQEVPVLAAALNVGGIILIDEKKPEDAKLYFESALKMDPNFILAQNNLQVATGMLEKGK